MSRTHDLHRVRRSGARCLLLAVTLPLLAMGCAAQDKMDQTVTANRSLREQIAAMQQERDQARADLGAAQAQAEQARGQYGALQSRYDELNRNLSGLDATNSEYLRRIAELEIGPLPIEVESAIEALARAHPEVLSFDREMGMVRFASDFTFDLGSTALKEDASTTLTALAAILNDPAARDLEARIVGHTDNVPIRRAETKRNHPTNVHLSVHRSIAVAEAITSAGVSPDRIMVAGYGEYRPIVSNARGGAAPNRRVEIYLAGRSGGAVYATDTPVLEPPSSPVIEPMK